VHTYYAWCQFSLVDCHLDDLKLDSYTTWIKASNLLQAYILACKWLEDIASENYELIAFDVSLFK